MASAAPQKRMVSSVFITLASPYRATVTQQQHARNTHNATARDMQHTAMRVSPGDSTHPYKPSDIKGSRHKQESIPSESHGSAHNVVQTPTTALARPPPLSPCDVTLGEQEQRQQETEDKGPGEVFPPPPPPPLCLDTEVTEDPVPPLPPPFHQDPPGSPLQPVSPTGPKLSLKRGTTAEPENITPSSGGDLNEPSHTVHSSPEDKNLESKEVCGFCRKPVALSEPAIEALNRTYHDSCFQCRQCHIPLAGQLYYNKAGIPLCEDCYQASLELCWACGEVIKDHVIRALERAYHPHCFICATCSQPIGEQRFAQGEVGEVYCLLDYYRKYAPQCFACQQLIIPREDGTDSYTVECLGRSFHEDCYRCEVCSIQLSPEPNDQGCHPMDGRVLCKACHLTLVQSAQH